VFEPRSLARPYNGIKRARRYAKNRIAEHVRIENSMREFEGRAARSPRAYFQNSLELSNKVIRLSPRFSQSRL
jgi:hypothetical protein